VKDKLHNKTFCVITVIFHYEKTSTIVEDKIEQIKQLHPQLKFYVVAAFSNIKNLTKLSQKYEDVKLVNTLCIVDFEELARVLRKNCLTSDIDLLDEKFFHVKFSKLASRYKEKLLKS